MEIPDDKMIEPTELVDGPMFVALQIGPDEYFVVALTPIQPSLPDERPGFAE